ncbi:MAG: hypothetical protein V6Z82_04375 [Flavobacteriales bacterium]
MKKNITAFIATKLLVELEIDPKVTDAEICKRVGLKPSTVSNYKSRYKQYWLTTQRKIREQLKGGVVQSIPSTAAALRDLHEADSRGSKNLLCASILKIQVDLYLEHFWQVEELHGAPWAFVNRP